MPLPMASWSLTKSDPDLRRTQAVRGAEAGEASQVRPEPEAEGLIA